MHETRDTSAEQPVPGCGGEQPRAERDSGSDAGADAPSMLGDALDWGSMSPSEKARAAAQIRWARRDAGRATEPDKDHAYADQSDDLTLIVECPARISAVIRGLEQAAIQGSAQAARELRAYLAEYLTKDGQDAGLHVKQPEEMDAAERERARAWLLRRIAEREQQRATRIAGAGLAEQMRKAAPHI